MEVPAGQVNFRGSLHRSKEKVLQPMLHPEMCKKHAIICIHASRELPVVFSKCYHHISYFHMQEKNMASTK